MVLVILFFGASAGFAGWTARTRGPGVGRSIALAGAALSTSLALAGVAILLWGTGVLARDVALPILVGLVAVGTVVAILIGAGSYVAHRRSGRSSRSG